MKYQLKIVCGDWSNDGHGMTDSIFIESNLNHEDIEVAYKRGAKEIGLDFRNDVARQYEDHKMSQAQMDILRANNINTEVDEWYGEPSSYSLDSDSYIEIFLEICKIGNYNFNYEKIETREVHIGGYGIFY